MLSRPPEQSPGGQVHRERARIGLEVVPAVDMNVYETADMKDDRAVTACIASIERLEPSS
jgi:hypothetical protein